ncbi:restriction endonuclease subunit S [Actinoplanes sp. NPDC020271]|uniref:restriction endonuclease subunit S n=1 Tax=Actinoplanes sp. NPDC020271 TaxID=3363896 RepID=UPI0037A060BF
MRLKDVVYINRQALQETTSPSYEFHYVDISSVDGVGSILVPESTTSFAVAPSRARRLAPAGATIISTVRTYLRAIGRVPPSQGPLVFSTGFAVLEAKPEVDPGFLYYLCRSEPFVQHVVARSVGVSYPAVNPSDVGAFEIDLPPIEEQRRIAEFLDAETGRNGDLALLLTKLRGVLLTRRAVAVRGNVLGAGMPGARRPAGLAWAESIPASWETVRLNLVARMGSGHTPSRSHPEWWVDCTIPWITTGEVSQVRDDRREDLVETREKISELGLQNSAAELHPAGTVVLCRTASAGYSAVMASDMATSQDFVTWTCGPKLDPYYLLWCLRAMRPDLLGRLAMGSTHKTIYVPDLQMLRVPLPPLSDQKDIVKRIREGNNRLDRTLDAIDRQLSLLAERRQALITAAVTRQIDVTTARGVG